MAFKRNRYICGNPHVECTYVRNSGWGGMYIKGVTERFGFDDSRISQIQRQFVKNKATGTPQGTFIYPLLHLSVDVASGFIYTLGVGLSTLLVSTNWAMREPLNRGTGDRPAPRFVMYVRMRDTNDLPARSRTG